LEIRTFLWNNLKNAIWIPEVGPVSVNKLSNLDLAKSIGFNVPDYMVTNSKDDLNRFFLKNEGKIITKAIGNFQNAQTMDGFLVNSIYTKQVDTTLIKLLPEKFALSFFQKLIEKKHEYRILYFNKKCYSALILSQEQELTKIDSRLQDEDAEARLVPVDISEKLSHTIIQFMEKLNLNTGCLDFLHGLDDKYYFLEVNPVGQIGG